jgi:hypothetical protein
MKEPFSGLRGKIRTLVVGTSAVVALLPMTAAADSFGCYPYSGSWYCQYTGRVQRAYVNSNKEVILYFENAISPSAPANVGASGVTVYAGAMYPGNEDPDFAKMLYASLLAAQARGVAVSIQMHAVHAGYLKMDRIWVEE